MTDELPSPRVYWLIFAALIGLTALTVLAAEAPLGGWHTPLGLAIASAKATLVVLFFMHVLYSSRLTWVVIAASLLMLGVGAVLTMADYLSRGWLRS